MKKRYQLIFIILALFLLYFVLSKVGFSNIINNLRMIKWYYLLLAILVNLSVFLVWTYKWKLLVDKISKVKFWRLFAILFTGIFFNSATPTANVGGEPLRAHFLGKECKKEKSKFLATVIIDKITNAGTALIFVIFSILFVSFFLKATTAMKVVTQSLVVILFILAVLIIFYHKVKLKTVLRLIYPLFKKKFSRLDKFERFVEQKKENMKQVLKEFYTNRKALRKEICLGLIMQILTFTKAYILFTALGVHVNPLYIILTVSIAVTIGQIIIVPGGIGVVESSMISMYALLGIDPHIAATVAILDRIIYYMFSLGLGYVMFTYTNYKYK
jgi:uncharacterized protein (TIRG00374 family)